MKSCVIRSVSSMVAVMVAVLPGRAAERLCSVYLESTAALQQQVQKASEVFAAPELGMFPMMMTMMVPGGSQVNTSAPVSLHIFDIGGGRTAGVLELTPATTADMFLKSLTAASGRPLEPAVNGRYTFEGGVAQEQGARLLLAKTAEELDLCTGGAVPALPPMPAIEGAVRIAMAPSAVVPMLDAFRHQCAGFMAASSPGAAQARETLELMFGLYTRTLAQINTINIGIAVQPEGLVVRKHLVPVSGSTVAEILASMQPIEPAYLSFVQKGSLFAMATGSYTLSDQLKRQLIALYINMVKSSPSTADLDAAELAFAMRESVESLGATIAWAGEMAPDGVSFRMQGAMGVSHAVAYLEKMVALSKLPVSQALMAQSGIRLDGPARRTYKDFPVYGWSFTLDEAAMRKQMAGQAADLDEDAFAAVNTMMRAFGDRYDYAATPNGITFGLGAPVMVERAADLLMADGADVSEATRIRALLSATAAPVAIGRFAILDAVRMGMRMHAEATGTPLPAAVAALPAGEGIVFADWIEGGEVKTALLIPATDVKALTAMSKSLPRAAAPYDLGGDGMDDDEDLDADEDLDTDEDVDADEELPEEK